MEKRAPWRPIKGSARRKKITIYAQEDTLAEIDEYVKEHKKEQPQYSRSDFYDDAAKQCLREKDKK